MYTYYNINISYIAAKQTITTNKCTVRANVYNHEKCITHNSQMLTCDHTLDKLTARMRKCLFV